MTDVTDVTIADMQTTITFEPDVIVGRAPAASPADGGTGDVEALRRILRPIIIDLLSDELNQYMRMRG
jgi:hypothetical protein